MRTSIILAIAIFFSISSMPASGKQYIQHVRGREVIVHTNPVPVVLHRLVPPQHGRHITERELRRGKLPPASRYRFSRP